MHVCLCGCCNVIMTKSSRRVCAWQRGIEACDILFSAGQTDFAPKVPSERISSKISLLKKTVQLVLEVQFSFRLLFLLIGASVFAAAVQMHWPETEPPHFLKEQED